MGTPGKLNPTNIGFSMPAHAPLFPRPPYEYQQATLLIFKYLTDADSAARMLPAQATLPDIPDHPGKAGAALVFARYPSSTLGPYLEVVQFLVCTYQEKPVKFATFLYVTTDVAMAAGREMGGYPKKIADIRIEGDTTSFEASLARPAGQPLVTATLTGLGAAKEVPADEALLKYLTLRIIPTPTKDAPPSLAELVLSDWQIVGGQEQTGTGQCTITGTSADDPLHYAPILHLSEPTLIRGNLLVTANAPNPSRLQPFEVS